MHFGMCTKNHELELLPLHYFPFDRFFTLPANFLIKWRNLGLGATACYTLNIWGQRHKLVLSNYCSGLRPQKLTHYIHSEYRFPGPIMPFYSQPNLPGVAMWTCSGRQSTFMFGLSVYELLFGAHPTSSSYSHVTCFPLSPRTHAQLCTATAESRFWWNAWSLPGHFPSDRSPTASKYFGVSPWFPFDEILKGGLHFAF